jgi:cell wall-associated NlpC family hydrolase
MTAATWAGSSKYQRISKIGNLQRGDILCFDNHMAIYLGNGNMIDASCSHGEVITRSGIWSMDYWNENFICGFRVF